MTASNVAVIRALYDAFGAGDIPGALGQMDPNIVWNEAENFPYADENPYVGPEAVLNRVFGRCASEWDGFAVEISTLFDAGDHVIATGRYRAVWPSTGRTMHPQIVHIWTLADGKVVSFQQHVDTLDVALARGVVAPI